MCVTPKVHRKITVFSQLSNYLYILLLYLNTFLLVNHYDVNQLIGDFPAVLYFQSPKTSKHSFHTVSADLLASNNYKQRNRQGIVLSFVDVNN